MERIIQRLYGSNIEADQMEHFSVRMIPMVRLQ